jgi:hypothetical protein
VNRWQIAICDCGLPAGPWIRNTRVPHPENRTSEGAASEAPDVRLNVTELAVALRAGFGCRATQMTCAQHRERPRGSGAGRALEDRTSSGGEPNV